MAIEKRVGLMLIALVDFCYNVVSHFVQAELHTDIGLFVYYLVEVWARVGGRGARWNVLRVPYFKYIGR